MTAATSNQNPSGGALGEHTFNALVVPPIPQLIVEPGDARASSPSFIF
jgi:hypothetical protein